LFGRVDLAVAQHLPRGRHQAGDRHLKFHEDRDNLKIDRHRTLVTGAARLAQLEPVLQVPDGSAVTLEWGERTVIDGQADAARITVRPYRSGMDVSVNPRISIDPEIVEWSGSPF